MGRYDSLMSKAIEAHAPAQPSLTETFAWPLALWLLFLATKLTAADLPTDTKAAAPAPPQQPVVIPFEFSRGHITVAARVNDLGPLSFLLDTGYALTMIHPAHAETLALKRVGHVTIVGIAGEEAADLLNGASFDLAGVTYTPRRIASLPSEAGQRRRRRDGILGHGFFKRFIIAIDPQARTLTLQEPKEFQYSGPGEIIPISFRKTTPIVEGSVQTPGGQTVKARFEIDTGCTGGLCLGHDFVEANKLAPDDSSGRGGARTGVGGATRTRDGHVPQLKLGRLTIDRPDASFFQEGSPVDAGLAGHIGLDVLRQFKIIFDYSRQQMILEPYPAKTAP